MNTQKVCVKRLINDQNYEWKEWMGTYVKYTKNECVEFVVHSCELKIDKNTLKSF